MPKSISLSKIVASVKAVKKMLAHKKHSERSPSWRKKHRAHLRRRYRAQIASGKRKSSYKRGCKRPPCYKVSGHRRTSTSGKRYRVKGHKRSTRRSQ